MIACVATCVALGAGLVTADIPVFAQRIIFVDVAATGFSDGTSWENAHTTLQDALATATSGDEIWVAEGVYYPDEGEGIDQDDVEATFLVPGGVSIFGGFDGTEENRDDRDWEANVTVLSGDLMQNDTGEITENEPTRQDNAEVVVRIQNSNEVNVLDGLHIKDGQGNGLYHLEGHLEVRNAAFEANYGHGFWTILGNVTGAHLIFRDNHGRTGGGLRVESMAVLTDLLFNSNSASREGGALWINETTFISGAQFTSNKAPLGGALVNWGELYLAKAQFLHNTSTACGGAFMSRDYSQSIIVNSIFAGNQALMTPDNIQDGGGAICCFEAEVDVVNSVLFSNHTNRDGGAAYVAPEIAPTSLNVYNSIFLQNTADGREDDIFTRNDGLVSVGYSIFESTLPDSTEDLGGNLFADPLFVNSSGDDGIPGTVDDDFRLMAGSPAIDAGSNAALPVDWLDLDGDADTTDAFPVDIAGLLRIFAATGEEARVDIGAHEFGAPPLGLAVEEPESGIRRAIILEIYPNPADREVHVRLDPDLSSTVTISLYNLKGQQLMKQRIRTAGSGSRDVTIGTHTLAGGIYFVVVDHAGGSSAGPLIVSH